MSREPYERFLARLREHRPAEPAAPRSLRSAVAVLLRPSPGAAEVLLMTRAAHERDPWSGHVALPGGRFEPTDTDLLATAVRETREEVGVDLAREAELVCRLETLQVGARGRMLDHDVTPYVFHAGTAVEPRPGIEASDVFWLPLGEASAGRLDHEHAVEREGGVRRFPAWLLEERVVWGLTWKVLCNLLAAARPKREGERA